MLPLEQICLERLVNITLLSLSRSYALSPRPSVSLVHLSLEDSSALEQHVLDSQRTYPTDGRDFSRVKNSCSNARGQG